MVPTPISTLLGKITLLGIIVTSSLHTLWSLLGGAYGADDIWNSQLPGQLRANHQSLLNFIVTNTDAWMKSSGRFFPTSIAEGSLAFMTFQTRFSYKIFLMAAVSLDLLLLYVFIAKLTKSQWAAYVAAALAAVSLNFHFTYDGIQEFSGQQEFTLAFILCAAIATLSYLDSRRIYWVVLIALFWALAITTYETSYLMLPVLWIAIWYRRAGRRSTITSLAASGLPTLLVGGYVLYLRSRLVGATSPSYTANFAPHTVATTLAKQLVGSLPFSDYYFGGSPDLAGVLGAPQFTPFTVLLLIAVAIAIALALYRQRLSARAQLALFLVGIVLFVAPAIPVAITVTWQNTLTWGLPYISAYVQGFGYALMFASLFVFLVSTVRRLSPRRLRLALLATMIAVCSVGGSFAILGVAGNNVRVITVNDGRLGWMNQQSVVGWGRQIVTDAEHSGLFGHSTKPLPIAVLTGAAWINSAEVSYQANSNIDIVNGYPYWTLYPQGSTQLPGCPAAPGRCVSSSAYRKILYFNAQSYNSGIVILGTFRSASNQSTAPGNISAVLKNPTIFVESPSITARSPVSLCRLSADHALHRFASLRAVYSGDNWRVLRGVSTLRLVVSTVGMVIDNRCVAI